MKMEFVISSWDIPWLPSVGSNARFPVRRIFCVGRNYVEHHKEMGGDGREQPFFFTKSAHDLVPEGGAVHFPPMTSNYHWETEMVAVVGTGGYKVPAAKANDHIWGYAVGLDMTRRDLQQVGKDKGSLWLKVKGERRGGGDRPDRRSLVEILAEGPGPAFVFSDLLQITPGHVEAHRVTPDVIVGFGRRHFVAACADHRDHLGLPVIVARHRRKVHGATLGDQIVSRFSEEERLLAAVASHLLLVLHIVAADTEDTSHGKACVRSRDGKRRNIPTADHILHFHDERSLLNRKSSAVRTELPGTDEKRRIFARTDRPEAPSAAGAKKTGTRRCPFNDKPVSEPLPAYDEYSNMRLVPLVTSRNLLAVQGDVETFPLLFLGDAQADKQVDHFEDDEAANAADEQGCDHAVSLGQEAGVCTADFLDVEHAGEERADDPADAVHTERVQRVVVAEHLFH